MKIVAAVMLILGLLIILGVLLAGVPKVIRDFKWHITKIWRACQEYRELSHQEVSTRNQNRMEHLKSKITNYFLEIALVLILASFGLFILSL